MTDVRIAEVAARQHNRISRTQLERLLSVDAIGHRVQRGRLVAVEPGVFAVAPVLDDAWGRWMGATLTAPDSYLSHQSAGRAYAWFEEDLRPYTTVTRPGSGGPRRFGGVRVYRSSTLDGECGVLRGVPVTSPERTLIDIASQEPMSRVARGLREAVRLQQTTVADVADALGRHRGRRGTARLGLVLASYMGLPLERARSGAEVRAMVVLRDAGLPLPRLNARIAGEEADLSWARARLVIEIDGAPFHLDVGADARKEAAWRAAGWTVRRIPSDAIDTQLVPLASNVRGRAL